MQRIESAVCKSLKLAEFTATQLTEQGSIKPFPVNVPISFDYICRLLFDEVRYKTSDEIKLENNSKISHNDGEPVATNYKNRILIK